MKILFREDVGWRMGQGKEIVECLNEELTLTVSVYTVPCTGPRPFCVRTYLTITALECSHLTDEETEVQSRDVACPRSLRAL